MCKYVHSVYVVCVCVRACIYVYMHVSVCAVCIECVYAHAMMHVAT